jgi:FtsP/CotA-like multicopper oxidase with cupredoxin domain
MGRKTGRDDSFWLREDSDKRRIRDAENARKNRQEAMAALSHGQVSRRDLVKWGLFTTAGTVAAIGGLSPFVKAQSVTPSFGGGGGGGCNYGSNDDGGGGTNNNGIPTGLPASPLFGALAFTQPMPRFDVLKRLTLAQLPGPAPTLAANTTQQPLNPGIVGGQTGLYGPVEGRPPGPGWAHQVAPFNTFPPSVCYSNPVAGVGPNTTYNPQVPSVENSGIVASNTFPAQFHPKMPVQSPNALWTYQGSLPPKLMQVRYGEPVLVRQFNQLAPNPSANNGFGRYTLTTHEHNAHHGAENDGFTGAYFWPGQFYDYYYPWVLAGFRSINTGATDPRAGAPNGSGGITNVPGDYRETMSTHWFHDHMFSFTAQNVYKGVAAMNNIYSSLDRGNEGINDGVNLRLPSGTTNDYGNLDFDVNLLFADKAFDVNGQLTENILAFDGFLGDVMTVNLAYRPFFNVYARRYRFRMLNAAVSRFFVFAVANESGNAFPFTQIANDGNLLPQTVVLQQTDQLGIAERYDIVIDFTGYASGTTFQLVNLQEHQNGEEPGQILTLAQALSSGNCDPCVGPCLQFNVIGPPPQQDQSVNPAGTNNQGIPLIPNPTLPASVRSRTFVFDHNANQDQDNPVTTYLGNGQWGIAAENTGGTSRHRGGSALKADFGRISSQPSYGNSEVWTLVNAGNNWDHPIHIHFEEGQILARTDSRGNNVTVSPAEKGRKDVYRLHPGGTVVVQLQFRDWGGTFMEHCHNTMHEDNAMLLRWDLDTGASPFLTPLQTPIPAPTGVTFQAPDEILPDA